MTPAKGVSNTGGQPASRVQLRLAELLRDGEWHNLEEVIHEVAKVVPPGPALRRNEHKRLTVHQRSRGQAPKERVKPLSEAQRIASGKRSIVMDAIQLKAFYTIDRDVPTKEERRIRMHTLPSKVRQAWEAMERHEWFDPEVFADKLQDDPHTSLSDLTNAELRRLVGALVDRLGEAE